MSGAASDRREETETIMLQHVHYFPREVIEPSARGVFIFGLWSREKTGERVRRGDSKQLKKTVDPQPLDG